MHNYQKYKHISPADEQQLIQFALDQLPEEDRRIIQESCLELQKRIGGCGAISGYELLYKLGRAIRTRRLTIRAS